MSNFFHRLRLPPLGRRAISALEFALVAPLLLTLMLLILEAGLVLFGQATLDFAAADASRLIRTGQVQAATAPQTLFTTRLCNDLSLVVACPNIQVNVQSAASFGALNTAVTVNSTGTMTATGFSPGSASQYVLVQVGYQPDESLPLIGAVLRAAFGPIIVSSVAFRNEAF
ncbi:MAG: pilus assembly protein [Rhodospirillales bacterium]|nr:pilus assembly protein [Rhodospirillales bacterium]